MSPDKLVYMANQIGKFFESQKHADPAKGIADHLVHFWDPAMRARIVQFVADGGGGLDPAVRDAVRIVAATDVDAHAAARSAAG